MADNYSEVMNQQKQQETPKYNINTALGNNYYKSLGQNDTYSAKDGSTWYRDQGGQVMVNTADGRTLQAQNNYTEEQNPNYYNIGSELGYDVYRSLPVGVSKSGFSDGSTWTKQADGSVVVTDKYGNQKLGVLTYGVDSPAQTAVNNTYYNAHGYSSAPLTQQGYVGGSPAAIAARNQLLGTTQPQTNVVGSNPESINPQDAGTTADGAGTQAETQNAPQGSGYAQYGIPQAQDQTQFIKDAYGANLEATNAGLQSSYEKNLSAIDAEEAGLGQNYYELQRQAQAQSDLQKNAYNEYANASGLNSGTRGQAALTQSNNLASQMNNIRMSEAEKRAELERQRTLLGQQYQSAIQQAKSQNDMQLAQALYEEAVRVDKSIIDAAKRDADVALQMFGVANENQQKAAAALAGAGDYSAYSGLYGIDDTLANQIKSASAKSSVRNGGGGYVGSTLAASIADDKSGVDYAKIYSDYMGSGAASLKEFILDNYKDYGINGSNRYAAANNVQAFVDGGGMLVGKNANGGYDYKAGNGYGSLSPQTSTQTYTNPNPSPAASSGNKQIETVVVPGMDHAVSPSEAQYLLNSGTLVYKGDDANGKPILRLAENATAPRTII